MLIWSPQLSAAPEALETMHLSLGFEPTVFSLESLTWGLDLLRLRFICVSAQKEFGERQNDRQEVGLLT